MYRLLILFSLVLYGVSGVGQEIRARIGTEFPLQHFIGINYQHNPKFSADLSYGINDTPYNDELYNWIRVPSDQESLKDFLQDVTDDGSVFSFGVNYHKDKWYFGVQAQYIRLNASASYNDIIRSDLVKEGLASGEKALLDSVLTIINNPLTSLIVNLEDEVKLEANLFQLGVKAGRVIQFNNPKLSMNVELGITANLSTTTTSTYDRNLASTIENFALTQVTGSNQNQILENLDFNNQVNKVEEFFEDYGFIPGLRIGFSYLLFKKEK